jgi:hypothetical protein
LFVEGIAEARWNDFRPRPTSTSLISNGKHCLREQCGTLLPPFQKTVLNS